MHYFREQLKRGNEGESIIDAKFAQWFDIELATMEQQRQGIDRIYTNKNNEQVIKVEHKTDFRAQKTHNAFVEIVSIDVSNKLGWAYTSKADMLLYYIPGDEIIYCIWFEKLRKQLPRWKTEYTTFPVENDGYHTIGLLVPLCEFEQCSEAQITL